MRKPFPGALAAAVVLLAGWLPGASHGFPVPGSPSWEGAYEFVNDVTGHYVTSTSGSEFAALTAGTAGPGWRRTGYDFAYRTRGGFMGPDHPLAGVCRFHAPGTDSHFLTADPAECELLKSADRGWIFEGIPFEAPRPAADGSCPAGFKPVYRLYNKRARFEDANHRFTIDRGVRAKMIARHWADEGIAFCAEGEQRSVERSFTVGGDVGAPASDCADGVRLGPCLAVRHLPDMTQQVDKTDGLFPGARPNPNYAPAWDAITGWGAWWSRLYTAAASTDPAAVAQASFVQSPPPGLYPLGYYGVHLATLERQPGQYASIAARYVLSTGPSVLGADDPVMPWRGARDSDVSLYFGLGDMRRFLAATGGSQAYGLPMVEFRDAAGGHRFFITIQSFGTVAPGDFTGRDVATGAPIVSTVFRADPAFGESLNGGFVRCSGFDGCAAAAGRQFGFRLSAEAFATALARARAVDPQLSPRPGDYRVASFECRIEAYGAVDVALTLVGCGLQVTY
jgi:hypothetical protein